MAKNSQDLLPPLAKARQELKYAQARVAELEANLSTGLKPIGSSNPPMDRRFQKLIERSRDHIALTNAQGKILYSNAVDHLLGYDLDEYLGLEPQAILHPDDLPKAQAFLQALLAAPNATKTIEIRSRHQQGYYVWIEVTATNLLHDPEIGAIVSNSRDISERKQAEAALHRSEALFRGTFEQAAVGIAHVAPDGRWLRVNQRLCEIVGYTAEELLGKTFQDLTHPADLVGDMNFTRQLLQGEIQFYGMQKRYFHQSGHLVWINLTVSLVRNADGVPDYFVAVIEDITQLKHAEQALIQSEERCRRVVEDQADLICRFDTDFRLTFVNQPCSALFGVPLLQGDCHYR